MHRNIKRKLRPPERIRVKKIQREGRREVLTVKLHQTLVVPSYFVSEQEPGTRRTDTEQQRAVGRDDQGLLISP